MVWVLDNTNNGSLYRGATDRRFWELTFGSIFIVLW